jgi:histidinol-phosphatase (PHP family)
VDDEVFIAKFKGYGADKVYSEYYNAVEGMIKTGFYNIVGHLDLPKKFKILPETPEKIWQQLLRMMDLIQKKGMTMEINTAGFLKPIGEQYPSDAVIQEAINRKIPITISSDCHDPINVAYNFDLILAKVKKMGLKYLSNWSHHENKLVPIK